VQGCILQLQQPTQRVQTASTAAHPAHQPTRTTSRTSQLQAHQLPELPDKLDTARIALLLCIPLPQAHPWWRITLWAALQTCTCLAAFCKINPAQRHQQQVLMQPPCCHLPQHQSHQHPHQGQPLWRAAHGGAAPGALRELLHHRHRAQAGQQHPWPADQGRGHQTGCAGPCQHQRAGRHPPCRTAGGRTGRQAGRHVRKSVDQQDTPKQLQRCKGCRRPGEPPVRAALGFTRTLANSTATWQGMLLDPQEIGRVGCRCGNLLSMHSWLKADALPTLKLFSNNRASCVRVSLKSALSAHCSAGCSSTAGTPGHDVGTCEQPHAHQHRTQRITQAAATACTAVPHIPWLITTRTPTPTVTSLHQF